MKSGRQPIHDLPINDITTIGSYVRELQREAELRGEQPPSFAQLQIGEPDFRTPEHIRVAAMRSIENEPLTYGPSAGWPWLRELIAEKIRRVDGYSVRPANVAITMGGTGAIQSAMLATLDAGDEVLIPDPGWPHYVMQLAASGAIPVRYPLNSHNDWLPDIAHLETLVTPHTRMIIINTPGNPTGAIFPQSVVRDLLDFANRHDLYLMSDECYDEIIFEGEHCSPATMLSRDELESGRFIGIYTFSKTYSMTGWRIGYVVTGETLMKTIVDVLNAGQTNMSIAVQRGAAAALTGSQECVAEMRHVYQQRRDLAVSLLKDYGRFLYTPHGAFYALIDVTGRDGKQHTGRQFSLDLLHERHVAVAPGSSFGSVSAPYVRVSLAASKEDIERGIRAICEFADTYSS